MRIESLLGHATQLWSRVSGRADPADRLVTEYLRSRKYLGAADRRFISNLIFLLQRTLSLSELIARSNHLPDLQHAALALGCSGIVKPSLVDAVHKASGNEDLPVQVSVAIEWCKHNLDSNVGVLDLCDEPTWSCIQPWILADMERVMKRETAIQLFRSMMSPAPLGLRVNMRLASRREVIDILTADGYSAQPGLWSESAVVIDERVHLTTHPLYRAGVFEIQDEGSQLVSDVCMAWGERPTVVLDACAGAGGKTLHLADLLGDEGRIFAADVEPRRLKEVTHRASKCGLTSVRTFLWTTERRRRPMEADLVLVDAPCSGMGTIRRLPMVKWRLTPERLRRYTTKQLSILEEYANHVKLGGLLVYATCSIMPDENEGVVGSFLKRNPNFVSEPAPYLNIPTGLKVTYGMQFDPLSHGTDGLYAMRLRRES